MAITTHLVALRRVTAVVLLTALLFSIPQSGNAAPASNDTHLDRQSYLQAVNVFEAWKYTTGSVRTTVAVIDSGVDIDHPDLKDNIWVNAGEVPGDGVDNDDNGYIDDVNGWDFINEIPDPNPKFSDGYSAGAIHHGTLIAGIIAASGNNKIGVAGISWRTKIMPLRVLNNRGEGDALTVAKAIDYAVKKRVDVVNLSFVGDGDDPFLKAAIEGAHRAGVVIVAASGNDEAQRHGVNLNLTPLYPVCYNLNDDAVIGVGALDAASRKANFSHYGRCIDIMAPGEDFFAPQVVSYEQLGFDGYYGSGWNGTSLSTAVVSGGAALLKSVNGRLTPRQVSQLLVESCDDITLQSEGYLGQLGCGRINIGSAVRQAIADLRATTLSPNVPNQTGVAFVAAPVDGRLPAAFFNVEGEKIKEWHPFAPYKVPFSLARSTRGDGYIVVGAGAGGGPHVRVFNQRLELVSQFFAYDKGFRGGVSVALADLDGDGSEEIVAAPGPGGGPHIKIFSLDGKLKSHFFAYHPSFRFGVKVATGDTDADGINEIVATPARNHVADVRVFTMQGILKHQFFAYPKTDTGSISLAVGDVDADGIVEIIVAPLEGRIPIVKVLSVTGVQKFSFLAFDRAFRSGVALSVLDLNHDNRAEIVVAPAGRGAGPQIRIFSPSGVARSQLMAFPQSQRGGLMLGAVNTLEY